ncbi:thermonuclease family protein [Paenibacillus sp. F411]|uniref:thermonuclease family protein n=1 Tax=Paenibacillus sp. F411 TaxID=2820239 RepID=UPI001AAE458B|nr:thermonuclease family protein [Paenibacillus sp. F411]MBO2943718.1 thermonuclease family protein [Paenibacillus sp. F411]
MRLKLIPALLAALLLTGCGSDHAERPQVPASGQAPASSSGADKNSAPPVSGKGYETDQLDIAKAPVQLVRAVDGDTIRVEWQGQEENVRFLLIDTPETSHPQLGVQPYGPEAKDFTARMVEEADLLELEFDIGPNRDKYGRLLAYVYADGVMVQEALLQEGLARVAYIYPPNVRYVDKFNGLQQDSRNEAQGIWSVENYAQEDGFYPEHFDDTAAAEAEEPASKATPAEDKTPANGCSIKGNINSKGDKIYHTPESRYYDATDPEAWFCSEQEAEAAGFRAPKS